MCIQNSFYGSIQTMVASMSYTMFSSRGHHRLNLVVCHLAIAVVVPPLGPTAICCPPIYFNINNPSIHFAIHPFIHQPVSPQTIHLSIQSSILHPFIPPPSPHKASINLTIHPPKCNIITYNCVGISIVITTQILYQINIGFCFSS